jgi:hypothetical protein
MYKTCYIEQASNGLWHIMWPDCTRAWPDGYKTKGWATRTLNWLNKQRS